MVRQQPECCIKIDKMAIITNVQTHIKYKSMTIRHVLYSEMSVLIFELLYLDSPHTSNSDSRHAQR